MLGKWPYILLPTLIVSGLALAIATAYLVHKQRLLHNQIFEVRQEREDLLLEQSQLLLESGSLASYKKVEAIASEQLGMRPPQPWELLWLDSK